MKKVIVLIVSLTYTFMGYAQQIIPQTLVYRDSIFYFYAWKNNVIRAQKQNLSKNETLHFINDNVVDTVRSKYTIFARNISSNDKKRENIIYKSGENIYRFSPKTGKIDTLLYDIPIDKSYDVAIGNQLIGYTNKVNTSIGCFITSYDISTKQKKVLYEIAENEGWDGDYSIWGIDASTTGLLLICLGNSQDEEVIYYTYDVEKNLAVKKDYSAYIDSRELYNSFEFSHDDISGEYMIYWTFWLNAAFDIVQPTLERKRSTSNFRGFKLKESDSYYYLSSEIDEPLQRNGNKGVWLACRFTLEFDKCLYKIYNNELLTKNDIMQFDEWELNKLKNMIFAKHDYKFKSLYLQAFYNLFSFYKGQNENVNNLLTPIDKKNLELIQQISKNKK